MSKKPQSQRIVPANFDNVVFKQWLRDKGDHRREALKKLKEKLQDLGLSRKQVHRGLVQLATKPLVVLARHTAYRRYGSKNLEERERSVDIETSCETDAAFVEHSPPHDKEDRRTPDDMQRISVEGPKPTKETERIKRYNEVSSSNKTYVSGKSCQPVHSSDKVLQQLDSIRSTKLNAAKLNNNRTSVIVSTNAIKSQDKCYAMSNNSNTKSMYRDEDQLKNINDDTVVVKPDIFRLMGDKDRRHRIKSPDTKEDNYAKSDVHQELNTSAKNTMETVSIDTKSTRIEGNVNKRRAQETTLAPNSLRNRKRIRVSHDERIEHDRRAMKNIKHKLRTFFGDCNSISEDEQEQDILQNRFKRRRKKDSIDSCDSGVCFSEGNGINSSNGIEIIKDIQKAVADSTMHEEISGDDTSEKNIQVTSQGESFTNGNRYSQNGTCNIDANIEDSSMIEEKLDSMFNENNLVQSTTASDITETSSEVVMSNINVLVSQETDAVNRLSCCSTPLVPDSGRDIDRTKDLPQSQTHILDFRDLEEFFNKGLSDTCEMTSNGNVLSIQEKASKDGNRDNPDKDPDLALLRMILETEVDCNQNIEQQATNVPNNICAPSKDSKDSSCSVRKVAESVPVKIDLRNLLGNIDGVTSPKSKLSDIVEEKSNNILSTNSESNSVIKQTNEIIVLDSELNNETEKKTETALSDSKKENENTPASQVPRFKLRVLSSAELGSRWCPTPVSVVISTTSELSGTNTVTMSQAFSSSIQNVPTTIPVVSTTKTSGDIAAYNLRRSTTDPRFSEAVRSCLGNIYNLILNTRISRVDNSIPLLKEFKNLKTILNARNYFVLMDGVINILNKELLQNQPLSFPELLHYVPSFKLLFRPKAPEQNNSSRYQNIPTIVSNETMKQNMHSTQGSQNVTSVEHILQNVFSSTKQTPAPTNIATNPILQNLQENVVVQQQNNVIQSNVPFNSTVTNCGIQQVNHRMPTQRPMLQPKPPVNPYFIRQHPVNNIRAPQQGIPLQPFPPVPINTNQLSMIYNQAAAVPAGNKSTLYNYLLSTNTFRTVNVPNHAAQQNMNQTQGRNMNNVAVPPMGYQFQNTVYKHPVYNVPQVVQLQNMPQLPQNIPVVNNTAPIVQNTFVQSTFVPNMPQSVPRNVQANEQVYQKIPVHQGPTIPQHVLPNQAPPGQQTQSTRRKQNLEPDKLESRMKQFPTIKYLSEIQKIMLLGQMNFYFGCTTWLQQQFTFEDWHIVRKERFKLHRFRTLLDHLVGKIVKNLTSMESRPTMSENNVLTNNECNIPKTVQIVAQENVRTRNQATNLNVEDQSEVLNINEFNEPRQERVNPVISEKQSRNEQIEPDNLSNRQSPSQAQEPEIIQGETVQKTKAEQTLIQQNQTAIASILEMQKTLDNNINETEVSKKESSSCPDSYGFDAVPCAAPKETLVIYDTKVSHKQSGVNSVTVEISSDSSEVTVIDINDDSDSEDEEMRLVIVEPKECEETMEELEAYKKIKEEEFKEREQIMQEEPKEHEEPKQEELVKYEVKQEVNTVSLKDILKTPEEDSLKAPKAEHSSEESIKNTSLEETTISHIADVRSITIEAFDQMENSSEVLATNTNGNIEMEEFKVCLVCSKLSTVLCPVCLEAKYCSSECYFLNWEEHYQDCKPVNLYYPQL